MKPSRVLLGIAVLFISLFVSTAEAPAKNRPESQPGPKWASKRSNFTDTEQLRTTSKQLGAHNITLSNRDLQRVIKAAAKRCGCASPTDDSWSSCFSGCLQGRGVSPTSAAACAAACAANLVGCAICAGIHEWIVMGCAQYCVWRDLIATGRKGYREDSSVSNRLVRPLRSRVTHQAKLVTNSGDIGS
jgi:hypothetical protein